MNYHSVFNQIGLHKRDVNNSIFIYDTSALLDLYQRYQEEFLSEEILLSGMHVIPKKVMEELDSMKNNSRLKSIIYQRFGEGFLCIEEGEFPRGLESRLPEILKKASGKENIRIGEGDKGVLALAILFRGEPIKILSRDSDISNLVKGLNLTNTLYLDTNLIK